MVITFNPFFDSAVTPALGMGKVDFGRKTVGQSGLLDELTMRCGMPSDVKSSAERITDLVEKIRKEKRSFVWSESFLIDPVGVARAVISWRDTLLMEFSLDRLTGISKRLDDIIYISGSILPGSADLWLDLAKSLEEGGVKPFGSADTIEVTAPEALVCKAVRRVLDSCGATVSYTSLSPAADQKVTIYRTTNLTDAYEWAAGQSLEDAVLVNADNRRFNSVLRMKNSPVTSARVEAGIPAPVQVLRMGLALLERPLNVHVLLAYLQCQQSPLPTFLRRRLAAALASDGGFGDGWDKVMAGISDDDRKKLDTYLTLLLEADIDDSLGAECSLVKEYLSSLRKWAVRSARAEGTTDEERSAFLTLNDNCAVFSSYLEGYGSRITGDELSNIVSGVCEGVEIISERAQLGSPRMASTPLALDSVPQKLVWLDCSGDGTEKYPYDFLTTIEQASIAEREGIISREQYASLYQTSMFRILKACPELVLFSPAYDMGGLLTEHPAVTAYKMQGVEETPLEITRYKGVKSSFIPKAELELGTDLYGSFSRRDSQSSIEKLIEYPFDYVTDYILHLYDSSELQLQDVRIVKGNVAHYFVERLVADCQEDLAKMQSLLDTEFDLRAETAIRRKGLVLNLKENNTEKVLYKKTLKESVETLVGILRSNGLTPVGCECAFPDDFCLNDPIGKFGGFVDFITRASDGSLVIIDFKWSESSYYEKKLSSDSSVQLALYRQAVEKKENNSVSAVGYFLFPKKMLYTCDNLSGEAVSKVTVKSKAAPLLGRIYNSVKFRIEQLAKGRLEMGEGLPKDQLEYGQVDSNDYVTHPDNKKGSPLSNGAESTPHQVLKDMVK